MPSDYSLSDVLERIHENQLALEAAVMELTLRVEQEGFRKMGGMSMEPWKCSMKTTAILSRNWSGFELRTENDGQLSMDWLYA